MSSRTRAAAALLLACLVTATGCGTEGLSFVNDERVDITAPDDRATVELPVTIDWQAEGFEGAYAVFLDQSPLPPNEDLSWLARDDPGCLASEGCPDVEYLKERDVFPTLETQVTIDRVRDLKFVGRPQGYHEATVILLDRTGRRVNEAAFTVEFRVPSDTED